MARDTVAGETLAILAISVRSMGWAMGWDFARTETFTLIYEKCSVTVKGFSAISRGILSASRSYLARCCHGLICVAPGTPLAEASDEPTGLGPGFKMISASGKNQQLSCSFQRFRPSAKEFLAAPDSVGPDGGIGTDVIAHAGPQFRADPEFAPGARAL